MLLDPDPRQPNEHGSIRIRIQDTVTNCHKRLASTYPSPLAVNLLQVFKVYLENIIQVPTLSNHVLLAQVSLYC
jgi:hypothetical protein